MIKPHMEHRRELLEDLTDVRDSVEARARAKAKAKQAPQSTIRFAWDTKKSVGDLLADLAEADINIGDSMFLENVGDPADFQVYNVVAYTEMPEMFPEGYTEEKAGEEFLDLLHTIVTIGV